MTTELDSDIVFFNGLDGASGDYLIPPLRTAQLSQLARGERFEPAELAEHRWRGAQAVSHWGLSEGIDPDDLSQAGWGVVFAADADPSVREALAELLDHRRAEADQNHDRYREFAGSLGLRRGESKNDFLMRMGSGPGPVDPDRVPYYLLIVGDPASIPYSFQTQLDIAHAVGRIQFDRLEDYANYARSVVNAETSSQMLTPRATFFGVSNDDDRATQSTASRLIAPLAAKLREAIPTWLIESVSGPEATKVRLARLFGDDAPAFLFTGSHGLGFQMDDPHQFNRQGALVCQDWPGPIAAQGVGIRPQWCLSADDIDPNACLSGRIIFNYACYGAGTPQFDEYAHVRAGVRERTQIAPQPFVSQLYKRLLSLPRGGPLALIGHIDRTWTSSFLWDKAGAQVAVFQSALQRIMEGRRVGYAMEYFNQRYAEVSTLLSSELEEIKFGKQPDERELAFLWIANNDARGYAIIGDPAVRYAPVK